MISSAFAQQSQIQITVSEPHSGADSNVPSSDASAPVLNIGDDDLQRADNPRLRQRRNQRSSDDLVINDGSLQNDENIREGRGQRYRHQRGGWKVDDLGINDNSLKEDTPKSSVFYIEKDNQTPTAITIPSKTTISKDRIYDPLYSPYYASLNDKEKNIYKQFYDAIIHLKKEITIDDYDTAVEAYGKILDAIDYDHPEIFWHKNTTCWLHSSSLHGQSISFEFNYNQFAENLPYYRDLIEKEAEKVAAGARKLKRPIDQELYVYDYLTNTIQYVDDSEESQTIYGALINHETVCAGFAKAFQLIMRRLGVPTYYLSGYRTDYLQDGTPDTGTHAWNVIIIDGKSYNVDLTGSHVQVKTRSRKKFEYVSYQYFNRTDQYFKDEGYDFTNVDSPELFPIYPAAVSTDADIEHAKGPELFVAQLAKEYPVTKDNIAYNYNDYTKHMQTQLMKQNGLQMTTYTIFANKQAYEAAQNSTWEIRERDFLTPVYQAKQIDAKDVAMRTIDLTDNYVLFIEKYTFKSTRSK